MTLRKIADAPRPCLHPGHNPPSMIVLEPGTYEHTCPGCGAKKVFVVHGVLCDESHRTGASEYAAAWCGGRYIIRPQVAELRHEPKVPADATRAG